MIMTRSLIHDDTGGAYVVGCSGILPSGPPTALMLGDGTAAGGNVFANVGGGSIDECGMAVGGCVAQVVAKNNQFQGGTCGVWINSDNSTSLFDFEDNTFTNQVFYGLKATAATYLNPLRGNSFSGIGAGGSIGDCTRSAVCLNDTTQVVAHSNRVVGNVIGVEVAGAGTGAPLRTTIDFGANKDSDPGMNVFSCNASSNSLAGFDVYIHPANDSSNQYPYKFEGNSWDHAGPDPMFGSTNGSDVNLMYSVGSFSVAGAAVVATGACP
jgi:hypothetical protein